MNKKIDGLNFLLIRQHMQYAYDQYEICMFQFLPIDCQFVLF